MDSVQYSQCCLWPVLMNATPWSLGVNSIESESKCIPVWNTICTQPNLNLFGQELQGVSSFI